MKKTIKLILIIFILTIIIYSIRNIYIIDKLSKKFNNTININNYIQEIKTTDSNNVYVEQIYKNSNKVRKNFFVLKNNSLFLDKIYYKNDNEIKCFFTDENQNKKVEIKNTDLLIPYENIYNPYEHYYLSDGGFAFHTLLKIFTIIYSGKYNDIPCYIIKNNIYSKLCIDKNTGLVLYSNYTGISKELNYSFNVVTDEDFIEPNIEEYEIIEYS